ncbi:BON domain-containing protein [Flavobacterium sp.]
MKADALIKLHIEKALHSSPILMGTGITVEFSNGEAFLDGSVDKYPKKDLARKIAKEVEGVKTVTERIKIIPNNNEICSDCDINAAITERFIKNFGNSHKDIKVSIREGYVWIEGVLKWKYQKDLAKECIMDIPGIIGIENNIITPEKPKSLIDEKDIFAAIYGDPSINTDIKIEIIGNRIVLKGKVLNMEQKNLVTRLVRNVDGVQEIENFLAVERVS